MATKSLKLTVPDLAPFDRNDCWFESFIGTAIRPVIESSPLKRFWFSRYGAVGHGKHILFRFEIDEPALIQDRVNALQGLDRNSATSGTAYDDYDYVADLGLGQASRFLGQNGRHQNPARRAELVFDFLHASALLFLDCLAGPDAAGYFQLEPETASGFSQRTSMEQFHHLFCNMTCAPTFVALATHPSAPNVTQVMSFHQFKAMANQDPQWHAQLVEVFN